MNLGYDMFDELKHNMNKADHFAHTMNITKLETFMQEGFVALAINEIRFILEESDVVVVVEFSYIREDEDEDFAKEDKYFFTMDADQVFGVQ